MVLHCGAPVYWQSSSVLQSDEAAGFAVQAVNGPALYGSRPRGDHMRAWLVGAVLVGGMRRGRHGLTDNCRYPILFSSRAPQTARCTVEPPRSAHLPAERPSRPSDLVASGGAPPADKRAPDTLGRRPCSFSADSLNSNPLSGFEASCRSRHLYEGSYYRTEHSSLVYFRLILLVLRSI